MRVCYTGGMNERNGQGEGARLPEGFADGDAGGFVRWDAPADGAAAEAAVEKDAAE